MYSIKISLERNRWISSGFTSEVVDIAFAYLAAIGNVKHQLCMEAIDFIPTGDGAYIIWADKKCQGVMRITEQEQADVN